MDVTEIMSDRVVSVDPYDQLSRVKSIFEQVRFHHLLVLEEGRLVGVISDRDLFKSISPRIGTAAETARDAATMKKRVHQVMARKVVILPKNASIYEAVHIFNRYGVSCLPVVDAEQSPVGIVTWRDLLRAVEPMLLGQLSDSD